MSERAIPACMGGFCQVRANCARYHAANRKHPAERLCGPSDRSLWQPVEKPQPRHAEAE